jgi:hypothetical protein
MRSKVGFYKVIPASLAGGIVPARQEGFRSADLEKQGAALARTVKYYRPVASIRPGAIAAGLSIGGDPLGPGNGPVIHRIDFR